MNKANFKSKAESRKTTTNYQKQSYLDVLLTIKKYQHATDDHN